MNFFINHIEDTSIPMSEKVLPVLSMMLINDGRHDFHKFHEMIQNAEITFSMEDTSNGTFKIANSSGFIKNISDTCCQDQYLLCYQFSKRDVNKPGQYKGYFTIRFNEDIKNDDYDYTFGVLKVPIRDDLNIIVR